MINLIYSSTFFTKIRFLIIFCFFQNIFAQKILEKRDRFTLETVLYEETKIFADGTQMSASKVDGVLYISENGKYYKRKLNGPVNVKWFGAKGDGDRNDLGTDDTQAVENAVRTLTKIYSGYDLSGGNLLGGATLYFPAGKYLISRTLVLPSNLTVKGESSISTVIHSRKPGFIFTNIGGFRSDGKDMIMNSNITISDLTLTQGGIELQGAVSTRLTNLRIMNLSGPGKDIGISIKLSVDLQVKDVKIFNSTGYGILFKETVGSKVSTTTTFENIWVAHCNVGMLVDGSDGELGIVSSKIYNSIFEYNKIGLQIRGKVDNLALRDMHFEQNVNAAIDVDGMVDLVLDNIWGDPVGELKISDKTNSKTEKKIYLKNFNMPYRSGKFGGKVIKL